MKRVLSGVLATVLAVAATAAMAQSKPPLKLGGILDMSGLYADITGPGSEMAAKMAAEDFGGEVLGRKIEIVVGDSKTEPRIVVEQANRLIRQDWEKTQPQPRSLPVSRGTPQQRQNPHFPQG